MSKQLSLIRDHIGQIKATANPHGLNSPVSSSSPDTHFTSVLALRDRIDLKFDTVLSRLLRVLKLQDFLSIRSVALQQVQRFQDLVMSR